MWIPTKLSTERLFEPDKLANAPIQVEALRPSPSPPYKNNSKCETYLVKGERGLSFLVNLSFRTGIGCHKPETDCGASERSRGREEGHLKPPQAPQRVYGLKHDHGTGHLGHVPSQFRLMDLTLALRAWNAKQPRPTKPQPRRRRDLPCTRRALRGENEMKASTLCSRKLGCRTSSPSHSNRKSPRHSALEATKPSSGPTSRMVSASTWLKGKRSGPRTPRSRSSAAGSLPMACPNRPSRMPLPK